MRSTCVYLTYQIDTQRTRQKRKNKMSEYKKAFETFCESVSEGIYLYLPAVNITVYTAQAYLEHDAAMAEEDFAGFLDSEELDLILSLEDALEIEDWDAWEKL